MQVKYTKNYKKSFSKLDKKIKYKSIYKIELFSKNPLEKSLNNHALNGKYKGFRSINVTGDYRAIFREYPEGTYEFVEFVDVGSHAELY